jgi:5-methylcytosine-specific restriction endonuclease McrA
MLEQSRLRGHGPYAGRMAVNRSRRARAVRKRKRRMDSVEHDLSDEQWAALKAAWGGCAYCGATGKPLQRDCVQALSRGGRYTLANLAPACGSCNASKCNDEVTAWLRRKRLDERAFLERHVEIQAALARQFREDLSRAAEGPGSREATPTTSAAAPRG